MTRLRRNGHALVPMRSERRSRLGMKKQTAGGAAYVSERGPHLLRDVHVHAYKRALCRALKARCKNARRVGENYQWRCVFRTMRPNFKMWPNVTHMFVLSDRYGAYAGEDVTEKIYNNARVPRIDSPTECRDSDGYDITCFDNIVSRELLIRPGNESSRRFWSCRPERKVQKMRKLRNLACLRFPVICRQS